MNDKRFLLVCLVLLVVALVCFSRGGGCYRGHRWHLYGYIDRPAYSYQVAGYGPAWYGPAVSFRFNLGHGGRGLAWGHGGHRR
jgi:hypothetical protein